MAEKKIPIIMDVDTGVDDALAILLALASDKLDLKAVTTTCGNSVLKDTTENTLRLLEFLGRSDIPVAAGADSALMELYVPFVPAEDDVFTNMHGRVGIGDVVLPECKEIKLSPLTACDLMAKVVEESEEPVWLVTDAALTNAAIFLHTFPHLRSRLAGIAMMGGASYTGNDTPCTEANIHADPYAAAIVFNSGVPITMCGLETTMQAYCTYEDKAHFGEIGGEIGKFVCDCLTPYIAFYCGFSEWHGCALHDGVPIAWLIDPEKVPTTPANVEVDLWGRVTFGATVVDYEGNVSGRECNALVADSIDREWYINSICEAIEKLAAQKAAK